MKGIKLSKKETLEALELYERINNLLADGREELNTAVFACALTNCLSDLIAQLSRIHGSDPSSLIDDVIEDLKRQIPNKVKHIEKIMSGSHSTNAT